MRGIHPFADHGNYITLHKLLVRHVMPTLSGSAWKILTFIILKTEGERQEWEKIAYSVIKGGCGIRSDGTVRDALRQLEGFVSTRDTTSGRLVWERDFSMPDLILRHQPDGRDTSGRLQSSYYSLNPNVQVFIEG